MPPSHKFRTHKSNHLREYGDKQIPEPNYRNIHLEIKSPIKKLSKFRQKID